MEIRLFVKLIKIMFRNILYLDIYSFVLVF